MRLINADAITQLAQDWLPLIEAADRSLAALAGGACEAPLRTSLALNDGQLLTMPGRLCNSQHAIVKLVTVVSGNAGRGLPTIQAIAFLFDATSGEPVAQFDGTALTAVRTAAISAAAVRRLAPRGACTLALIGAGSQAPWQARALASVLSLQRLTVWAPTRRRRDSLAAQLDAELSAGVDAASTLEEALSGADVICCATTATEAFLHTGNLPAHPVLIVAIGAFRPDMAEVGVSALRRAGCVYVDDPAAVMHEAGDVMAALSAGALTRDNIVPIGSVQTTPRSDLTIFKSVGSAAEDAAVAEALL